MNFPKKITELLMCIMEGADKNTLAVIPCKDKEGGDHFVLIGLAGHDATPLAIVREDLADFLAKPQGITGTLRVGRVCACGECHTPDGDVPGMPTANKLMN